MQFVKSTWPDGTIRWDSDGMSLLFWREPEQPRREVTQGDAHWVHSSFPRPALCPAKGPEVNMYNLHIIPGPVSGRSPT